MRYQHTKRRNWWTTDTQIKNWRFWRWDRIVYSVIVLGILIYFAFTSN